MCYVPDVVLTDSSPTVERERMNAEDTNMDASSSSSNSSEASTTPRSVGDNKQSVFVHDPYTWWCRTSPSYVADERQGEAERIRIFCSGKGIPNASNEEFLKLLGPVEPFVVDICRPRGGRKEFLYVELVDELAVEVMLSYHPMKFKGQRLNISMAKPAQGNPA